MFVCLLFFCCCCCLHSDVEKIQAGIGDRVSLFLNYFSTFLSGFIIAFFFSWKMALVVSVMLPILAFISAVIAKVTTPSQVDHNTSPHIPRHFPDHSVFHSERAECVCSRRRSGRRGPLLHQNCGGLWRRKQGGSKVRRKESRCGLFNYVRWVVNV